MKVTKLVLGIITIILSCFVLFQSCAAGVLNTLEDNGESSGTAGSFVALIMLAGGIVMIASRKNLSKGGPIACIVMFVIAAITGFSSAGEFKDLNVWAGYCLILAIINIIAITNVKKCVEENEKNNPQNK